MQFKACLVLLTVWVWTLASHAIPVADTLNIPTDPDPIAQACLDQIGWPPQTFEVDQSIPTLVRFPSPHPSGIAAMDQVVLHRYVPQAADAKPRNAVLIVHSLHPDQPLAKMMARGLAQQGIDAFVLDLPGFGLRPSSATEPPGVTTIKYAKAAAAEVRRARDVIAALSSVAGDRVALVGISLGGFVGSVGASLDNAFDPVFLIVSGADSMRVLEQGNKDAFLLKQALADVGFQGEKLKTLIDPTDPMHLVHRLNPQRTWLFSARFDTVIPRACSDLLAQRIGLNQDHRRWLAGNHYTSMWAMPALVAFIAEHMR